MFSFDRMLTPYIIIAAYWLTLLVMIIAIFVTIKTNTLMALALIALAVLIRIPFEAVMIAFKNNEYLRVISENITKKEDWKPEYKNEEIDADFADGERQR